MNTGSISPRYRDIDLDQIRMLGEKMLDLPPSPLESIEFHTEAGLQRHAIFQLCELVKQLEKCIEALENK